MKLGYMAVSYEDTLKDNVKFGIEQDFEYLEYAFVYLPQNGGIEFSADMIKKEINDTKIKISSVGLFNFNSMGENEDEKKPCDEYVMELFDAGVLLGAKIVILGTGVYKEGDDEANITQFKKMFKIYNNAAKERGLELTYYMGGNECFVRSYEMLERLLNEVPEMKFKFDPMSIATKLNCNPYKVMRKFGDRINHLHAHELIKEDGYQVEPAVGMGGFNWGEIFGMLHILKYKGFVIIEPHGSRYGSGTNRFEHVILSKRNIGKYFL